MQHEAPEYQDASSSIDDSTASKWRWFAVIPAFALGFFIPGLIARISWESTNSFVPFFDVFWDRFAEYIQAVADGSFSVVFAAVTAPHHKRYVALIFAVVIVVSVAVLLTNAIRVDYYRNAPGLDVFWNILLMVTTPVAAVIAAVSYMNSGD